MEENIKKTITIKKRNKKLPSGVGEYSLDVENRRYYIHYLFHFIAFTGKLPFK